jgi:hypothetical protein
MKSYNGFSPCQRQAAFNWLKAECAAGRRVRPAICDACQQDEGFISAHSEDYSAPFGDHIGQYSFCYTCHMQVHCRFGNPEAWQAYRDAVRGGAIFKPFHGRAFHAFVIAFLRASMPEPARYRLATGETVLDQIETTSRPQIAVKSDCC